MIKINSLEFENVKKIKALTLTPSENGLTVIGGKNGQGKTSVLDAIAWALGGAKFAPSEPMRDGSVLPPALKITLNNGMIVERTGKNSTLKVTDTTGQKGGQQILDEFIEELALNLPKFLSMSNKEKANVLLQIIGVGSELARLEAEEKKLYDERHTVGVIGDTKKKYVSEMPFYEGVPNEPVSVAELITKQQEILSKNGEIQRKRMQAKEIEARVNLLTSQIEDLKARLERLNDDLFKAKSDLAVATVDKGTWNETPTDEIEKSIADIDALNRKIRTNLDREKASIEADSYKEKYDKLTSDIDAVREQKQKLLDGADLPLPGLSVDDGELTYNGYKWDNMSSSEQLKVGTAIIRKLNPECGFVLIDKLEQMDVDTMREFGEWIEENGLQAIATRVSTGEECSVIIEDGSIVAAIQPEAKKEWKEGIF